MVLFMSWDESPTMPLRLWIGGYAFQCVLHMVCVWVEYKRRYQQRTLPVDALSTGPSSGSWWNSGNSNSSSASEGGESVELVSERPQNGDETR